MRKGKVTNAKNDVLRIVNRLAQNWIINFPSERGSRSAPLISASPYNINERRKSKKGKRYDIHRKNLEFPPLHKNKNKNSPTLRSKGVNRRKEKKRKETENDCKG